ncbi:PDR/VanB family oxidoreductase [Microbacterium album]|uniref:Oxidoreductase n=1 Tax=Microbacterium album TaxID=2053191 RepID=A0A917IF54_9MICO|nr:PDR/VanB family oxidoreductase [Microbacterium album]GGH46881.1 putative oxidoreductase [Microbacterium album]
MRGRDGMLPLIVREIAPQTPSIVSIRLEDPAGAPLPAWEAGAHIDVQLVTRHERQYSLCGDPADASGYRIAVLREELSRGASHYIHSFLRVGARVYVRSPRNMFPLADARSYLLLAGGIGITPMLAMARELAARNADWRLLYLVRTRNDVAFAEELAGFGERVQVHVSGESSRIDIAEVLGSLAAGTDVYACGPARLVDALEERAALLPRGSALHVERFEPALRQFRPNVPFTLVCAASDVTVEVPAESSMLHALGGAGIELPASCLRGVCGSCAVPLLEGQAEHRDSLGADDASGIVYPCVSRALGPTLVIDA